MVKKSITITSKPKVAKPKKVASDGDEYSKMKVVELKALCKSRHVPVSECNVNKQPLIDLLKALDAVKLKPTKATKEPKEKATKPKVAKKEKVAKKKPSPATKKPSPKKASASKKTCKPDSCPDGFCILESGECVGKTKTKTPLLKDLNKHGVTSKSYKEEYEYDAALGVVGLKSHVAAYRKSLGGETVVPKKEKVVAKKTAKKAFKCYDSAASDCASGDICSTTGKCVKDNDKNRKGKLVLVVDGRSIIGSKETIEKLQKTLGGEIVGAEKKIVRPATPPKPVKEKKPKAKKTKSPKKPKEMEILVGDSDDEELETLRTKSPKIIPKTKTPVISTKPMMIEEPIISGSVDLRKKEIQETFKKCLSRLKV
jgi:hypothetical protein